MPPEVLEIPDLKTLSRYFRRHGVSTTGWGKIEATKSPEYLLNEIKQGETQLSISGKLGLVRDVCRAKGIVLCDHPERGMLRLWEVGQTFMNGFFLPGSHMASMSEKVKWLQGETYEHGLLRGLEEELGLTGVTPDRVVDLVPKIKEKKTDNTRSYPTLATRSRDKLYVVLLLYEHFERMRLEEHQAEKVTTWEWRPCLPVTY